MSITKKIVITFLLSLAIIPTFLSIGVALAADTPELYPTVVQIQGDTGSKISYLERLPGGDWRYVLANIIKLILQITGSLTIISFTVGGVMMIVSQGNEEQLTKGKTIMLWSVGALVIIASSYAIVLGITQLALV